MQSNHKQLVIFVFAILLVPLVANAANIGVVGDSLSAEYKLDDYDDGLLSSSIIDSFDMDTLNFGNTSCDSQTIGELLGFGGSGPLGFDVWPGLLDLAMGLVPMYTDFPARNWVQQLELNRSGDFNFGPVTDDPDLYGEPRLRGHEYNFARVSGTVLSPGLGDHNMQEQVDGILPYVPDLDVVFVMIGSNDFAARELKAQSFCDDTWYDFRDDLIAEMFQGVDALAAAGADKILIGVLPLGTAAGLANGIVLERINETNVLINLEAAARGIPTLDVWAFNADPTRVNQATGDVYIGGYTIGAGTAADASDGVPDNVPGTGVLGPCDSNGKCGTLATTLNFATTDGLHPNTPIQGLIANEIIKALNTNFGYNVAELTDQEILEAGGTFVPEPATIFDPGKWVQIRQKGPNRCLKFHSNNENLTVGRCKSSNLKHRWYVIPYGDSFMLRSASGSLGHPNGTCITDDGWRYTLENCTGAATQLNEIWGGGADRNWFISPESRDSCYYRYWFYEGGKLYGSLGNCGLSWGWNYMRWGFYLQGSTPKTVEGAAQ